MCNVCLGPICAVTGLGYGQGAVGGGVCGGAGAAGDGGDCRGCGEGGRPAGGGVVERMIGVDPLEIYLCPGMLADVWKVD